MVSPKNSSTSAVLDACHMLWPGAITERTRPPEPQTSPEHQRRFNRLCANIRRDLDQGGDSKRTVAIRRPPRTARARRSPAARARRSPSAAHRATADSGGDSDGGDPAPEPLSHHERGQA